MDKEIPSFAAKLENLYVRFIKLKYNSLNMSPNLIRKKDFTPLGGQKKHQQE